MATGFSTRSGPDGYRLNFDTDNLDYYLLMQKIARHCVDGKPAADVALVRHGRWIELDECANEGVYCSVCRKKVYRIDYAWSNNPVKMKSPYCPSCGALMGGKENEHEAD